MNRKWNIPVLSIGETVTKQERRNVWNGISTFVYWEGLKHGDYLSSDDTNLQSLIESYRDLGKATFGPAFVIHLFTYYIKREGQTIPYSGLYKNPDDLKDNPTLFRQVPYERREFFRKVIGNFRVDVNGSDINVFETRDDGDVDITDDFLSSIGENSDGFEDVNSYQTFTGSATQYTKDFIKNYPGLLVILDKQKKMGSNPIVYVDRTGDTGNKTTEDYDVLTDPNNSIKVTLEEDIKHRNILLRRDALKGEVDRGRVKTIEAFGKNDWPRHPLMDHVKQQVVPFIEAYVQTNNLLCDPLDLQYQVMFRLTTVDVNILFEFGAELKKYLEQKGAYDRWQDILSLDSTYISQFRIPDRILEEITEEQMRIVQARVDRSTLSSRSLLMPEGIFAENGWEIKKDRSDIFVVRRDSTGTDRESRGVLFRPVSTELANQIHADLHYIHTPRSDMAFVFFLEGDEIPFSVLAITEVDRTYKQNAVLMYGFDPRNVLDFSRLYSRPGVPKNTSSAIIGETFSFIRSNLPKTEAAITSFMSTYATGLSMLTGGFSIPILAKPTIHTFSQTEINGANYYEHLTKRRQSNDANAITTVVPLLPTVELLSKLRSPRF